MIVEVVHVAILPREVAQHVRFTPDSGHSSVQVGCPKSAKSGHLVPSRIALRRCTTRANFAGWNTLRILRLPQGFYAAKNRSSSRWRDEPSPTSGDHRHRPRQKLGSDAWGSFRSAFGYGLGPR